MRLKLPTLSSILKFFGVDEPPVKEPGVELPYEVQKLIETLQFYGNVGIANYSIRHASRIAVSTYSSDIVDLLSWTRIAFTTIVEKDYVPDRWKFSKRLLDARPLDEYFSKDGFDIDPHPPITEITSHLTAICTQLEVVFNENEMRGNYYLRQFKSILIDGAEVLEALCKLPR